MDKENEVMPADAADATQAADFARLQVLADEQTDAAPGVVEAAPPDMAGELAALVTALVAIAAPILPSLPKIYTPEATGAACAAVAAVCEKHGWMQGGFLSEWGVEVGAAVVLVPLAVATYQGVQGDMARARYIEKKKAADLQQHLNIAHNADGLTEKPSPFGAFGNVEPAAPAPAPAEGGAVEN